jgi:thiamine pyrophosphate-dependent acetolactate synthase large subunit-like protein
MRQIAVSIAEWEVEGVKISASTGVARILKAEGIPWVSTYPVCCVNDALGEEGVPLIMMRDDRYATALADAFSRVTGGRQIGVCTLLGGVNAAGLQIAYGAIAQAFEDSSPVLCISDGVQAANTYNSHFDITEGFRAVTKWIGHINQAQRVPEFMRRAFTYLRTGRPGPVLLTIPPDLGEYDDEECPYTPIPGWKPAPNPDDVKTAIKALLGAKRPLLFIGDGVFYGDATGELLQFAELAQVPVLTTLKAKSAFPERHPLSVGVRGELASHFLRDCDLLFAIGASLSPGRFSHGIPNPNGKVIIQCTVDERDINKSYKVDQALIGDAKLALLALIDELSRQTAGGVRKNEELLAEIKTAKERFLAKYRPAMESNDRPINPYRVYADLMKVLDPSNSFVSPDSGNTRDQSSTVYESEIPHGFLGWGNVSTLGFSLAGAMAAKLAYPERQCVNITGDAGIAYMIGNLEALVRYNVGVTTIYINNGGFSGYGPGFWGKGSHPYTFEVSKHNVADTSAAVRSLGYHAEDVTEPSEIIPALERALEQNAHGQPALVEFICSQYPVVGRFEGKYAG